MMRVVLILAVLAGALWTNFTFSQHYSAGNPFETLYRHLEPAPLVVDHETHEPLLEVGVPFMPAIFDFHGDLDASPPRTVLYNVQIFQIASLLLIFVAFSGVPAYLRTGQGDGVSKFFAGFALWVRDEMVYPVMGKKTGNQWLPYFLIVFFFLIFLNVMGLLPFSATATASIFVTCAMALTTFFVMIVFGMKEQGAIAFWKNLVPHVPAALWPLMFLVEVVGLLVKPFALMIRLFANMNGGHMVVLSFMGLIFFFSESWGAAGGWGSVPVAIGFAVFIMIIESFVAMLQAYIFTQLSILFVYAAIHPDH